MTEKPLTVLGQGLRLVFSNNVRLLGRLVLFFVFLLPFFLDGKFCLFPLFLLPFIFLTRVTHFNCSFPLKSD